MSRVKQGYMRRLYVFFFAVLLVSSLCGCFPATATRVPALTGRVIDENGQPVPKALIEIKNKPGAGGWDVTRSFVTDSDGAFTRNEETLWMIYFVPGDVYGPTLLVTAAANGAASQPKEISGDAGVRFMGFGPRRRADLGTLTVPTRGSARVPIEAQFRTDAFLSLRAQPYPPGEWYDRPYWKVELVVGAFRRPWKHENTWTRSLGIAPAGSERGEPFLHKLKGPCEAEVCIGEDTIALYLHWTDESLILSHAGTMKVNAPGREDFDEAVRQIGKESFTLAVDFKPRKDPGSFKGFTTGPSLITGVPGNLSAPKPTMQGTTQTGPKQNPLHLLAITNDDLSYDANTAGIVIRVPQEARETLQDGVPDRESLIKLYRGRLDDPDSWIAAHAMLSSLTGYWRIGYPDRERFGYFNGLEVHLRPTGSVVDERQKAEIQRRWKHFFDRVEAGIPIEEGMKIEPPSTSTRSS